jgi:hypothetical protein
MHGVSGFSPDMFASMFVCMHTTFSAVSGGPVLPLREEKGERPNEEHLLRELVSGERSGWGTAVGVLSVGVFS